MPRRCQRYDPAANGGAARNRRTCAEQLNIAREKNIARATPRGRPLRAARGPNSTRLGALDSGRPVGGHQACFQSRRTLVVDVSCKKLVAAWTTTHEQRAPTAHMKRRLLLCE